MTLPWGHKLTIYVYVEGDMERAVTVSGAYATLRPEPAPTFVGISISEVVERPHAQGESTVLKRGQDA